MVEEVASNGIVTKVRGRDIKIALAIANHLNFSLSFFEPKERSWGSGLKANGHFPGMVGTIYRRESDILIDSVTVTKRRWQSVDFSFLTHGDSACFITKAPQPISATLAVIRPFSSLVWGCIGACIFISGPLLFIFSSRQKLEDWREYLFRCILITTRVQLTQNAGHVEGNAKRIFFIFWALLSFFLTTSFSGNLTSFYTYPGFEAALESLDDLKGAIEKHEIYAGVEKGSSTESMMKNADGILFNIWHLMAKDATRNVLLEENSEGVNKVLSDSNYAWLGGRGIIKFAVQKIGVHKFHINEELFISPKYKAVVLQKGSPYLHIVNMIVMRLFEAGLLDKWMQDEYRMIHLKTELPNIEEKPQKAITIEGIFGPLLIWVACLIVAGCCFLVEMTRGRLCH